MAMAVTPLHPPPARRLRGMPGLVAACLLATQVGLARGQTAGAPMTNSNAATPGAGSTIFRCPDGQYRDSPCPGGRALATDPAPSAEQRAQAQEAAAKQAQLAERMKAEREARERAAARQGPIRIGPEPTAQPRPTKAGKAARPDKEGKRPNKKSGQRKPGPTRLDHQPEKRDALGPAKGS